MIVVAWTLGVALAVAPCASLAQAPIPRIFPEQRALRVRDPAEFSRARLPESATPPTVAQPTDKLKQRYLSLDDAIRWSMTNSEVVRVLAGVQAVSSGSTIYDAAITNTQIDQQQARFDPNAAVSNAWSRSENPFAIFDPNDGTRALLDGQIANSYDLRTAITQQTPSGAEWALGVGANPITLRPGIFPLNPQSRSSTDITLRQPLLQGFSTAANLAPVVIARIETERSYFQTKDSLQENLRSVVEGYWALVNARTDAWTRRQQVLQAEEAFRLADARLKAQINNSAEVAQSRFTLANFRAQKVVADGLVLQREAALRNLLGFPPADGELLVPSTPPTTERFEPDWNELVAVAAERRPDLIELKLIIEADEQLVVQARNQALPRVDGIGQYRWNGLEGEMPIGDPLRARAGQYSDWTLGVNFSVPLGLRQSRAALRRNELLVARDRANLQQGLHAAVHQLATSVRSLAQAYEQYLAFKEAREAARANLNQQQAQYRANRVIFLNVLQAITDWGNAISAEANALAAYNTLLAELERQTGTILETHGIVLYEESFGSIGPAGRLFRPRAYPLDARPSDNDDQYRNSDGPAEEAFGLTPPVPPSARPDAPPINPLEPLPPPPRPQPDDGAPNPPEALQPPDNGASLPPPPSAGTSNASPAPRPNAPITVPVSAPRPTPRPPRVLPVDAAAASSELAPPRGRSSRN